MRRHNTQPNWYLGDHRHKVGLGKRRLKENPTRFWVSQSWPIFQVQKPEQAGPWLRNIPKVCQLEADNVDNSWRRDIKVVRRLNTQPRLVSWKSPRSQQLVRLSSEDRRTTTAEDGREAEYLSWTTDIPEVSQLEADALQLPRTAERLNLSWMTD